MPDPIMKFGEEILIAFGTIVGVAAVFWSRFAGLFPAKRSDIAVLRECVENSARQQEEFHADIRKANERFHSRLDLISERVHRLELDYMRISTACNVIQRRDQEDRGSGPAE